MSNKRAESRRKQRVDMKLAKSLVKNKMVPYRDITDLNAWELSQRIGVDFSTLRTWGEDKIEKVWDYSLKEANDILWRAENYMALANVIMMLYAVKMTFGDLRTVQKGMNRLIKNLTPAMEYIDRVGIMEAYRQLNNDFDIGELEFEDFDITELWDHSKEIEIYCKVFGGGYGKSK